MDLESLRDTPPWDWPENTAAELEKALTEPATSPALRLIAADLAGDSVVINDRLAGCLLKIIANPAAPEDLRAAAAISLGPALESTDLGDFDDDIDPPPLSELTFEEIKKTFRKLHADKTQATLVRRRILEASVRAEQDWHADAIRAAYNNGDRDWVLTAVFCMQYVEGFDPQILKQLDNPDPEIQAEALFAAGDQAVEAAWPHVARLLENPMAPRDLLLAAISAAATVNHEEAPALLRGFLDSPDEEIDEAAREALEMAEGETYNLDGDDDLDIPF